MYDSRLSVRDVSKFDSLALARYFVPVVFASVPVVKITQTTPLFKASLISTQKILSEIFRAKFFLEKSFRSSISTLVKYSCEILSEEKLPRPIPESKQT